MHISYKSRVDKHTCYREGFNVQVITLAHRKWLEPFDLAELDHCSSSIAIEDAPQTEDGHIFRVRNERPIDGQSEITYKTKALLSSVCGIIRISYLSCFLDLLTLPSRP